MIRQFYLGALLLGSTISLSASCAGGENNPPVVQATAIQLTPAALTFSPEGGSQQVQLQAPSEWSAFADAEWVAVSPKSSLSPKGTLTVTVAPNTTAGQPRSTTLTVRSGTARQTVSITQSAPEIAAPDPNIPTPEGYALVWQEEFDQTPSADGRPALVNASNWRFENWAPGTVNNELQRYVAGGVLGNDTTAMVKDGALHITLKKRGNEVLSARMNSRESWQYGYVEDRIRLPKGKGTWPAFWMMPVDQREGWPACGEIDIMEEVGTNPNYTSSSIHCTAYNHVKGTQKTAERFTAGAEGEYHVYALEWTADYIRTFVDGQPLFYFANDGQRKAATWPFDKPFFVILNLAWGGMWGGMNGVDESALPTTMSVDYVRVFQRR